MGCCRLLLLLPYSIIHSINFYYTLLMLGSTVIVRFDICSCLLTPLISGFHSLLPPGSTASCSVHRANFCVPSKFFLWPLSFVGSVLSSFVSYLVNALLSSLNPKNKEKKKEAIILRTILWGFFFSFFFFFGSNKLKVLLISCACIIIIVIIFWVDTSKVQIQSNQNSGKSEHCSTIFICYLQPEISNSLLIIKGHELPIILIHVNLIN